MLFLLSFILYAIFILLFYFNVTFSIIYVLFFLFILTVSYFEFKKDIFIYIEIFTYTNVACAEILKLDKN